MALLDTRMRRDPLIEGQGLLGIEGEIGQTDSSFQRMGRAPVDELFAGRFSVNVDDKDFAAKEKNAGRIRNVELANKEWAIEKFMREGMSREDAEFAWMGGARERIQDETGLALYPGDLTAGEKEPQFMQEISDRYARAGTLEIEKMKNGKQDHILLGQLLHHPEIWQHYPEAQFMPVTAADPDGGYRGAYGNYNHAKPGMEDEFKELAPLGLMQIDFNRSNDEITSTILHELQHYISSVEGWENGGSPNQDLARQYIDDQLSYEGDKGLAGEWASELQDLVDDSSIWGFMGRGRLADKPEAQYQAYADLSGEELARAVQDRWENNRQGEYFYGSPDKHEEQNWNQEEGTISPLSTTADFRSDLSSRGLLGFADHNVLRAYQAAPDLVRGMHPGKRDRYVEQMRRRIAEINSQ